MACLRKEEWIPEEPESEFDGQIDSFDIFKEFNYEQLMKELKINTEKVKESENLEKIMQAKYSNSNLFLNKSLANYYEPYMANLKKNELALYERVSDLVDLNFEFI